MSLVRWDPFSDMDALFSRLLPSTFARWPLHSSRTDDGKATCAPPADISETDQEYVIRAALPAVKREDVEVTLDAGIISIKGERKQQKEDKNEKYHRIESFYGTFERSFSLPENVDADGVRCESNDGVLTIHIPKSEVQKAKPKQIIVQ